MSLEEGTNEDVSCMECALEAAVLSFLPYQSILLNNGHSHGDVEDEPLVHCLVASERDRDRNANPSNNATFEVSSEPLHRL